MRVCATSPQSTCARLLRGPSVAANCGEFGVTSRRLGARAKFPEREILCGVSIAQAGFAAGPRKEHGHADFYPNGSRCRPGARARRGNGVCRDERCAIVHRRALRDNAQHGADGTFRDHAGDNACDTGRDDAEFQSLHAATEHGPRWHAGARHGEPVSAAFHHGHVLSSGRDVHAGAGPVTDNASADHTRIELHPDEQDGLSGALGERR